MTLDGKEFILLDLMRILMKIAMLSDSLIQSVLLRAIEYVVLAVGLRDIAIFGSEASFQFLNLLLFGIIVHHDQFGVLIAPLRIFTIEIEVPLLLGDSV